MTDEAHRFGKLMFYLFWVMVLALLSYWGNDFYAKRNNPNRHVAVTCASGDGELVLQRNAWGHYVAPGTVNGQPVTFLLDTGATEVAVPAHLGGTLGLEPGGYYQVNTANGTVGVRATRIEQLELGPFVFHDLRGQLNPGIREDEILLGMSALKHLEFTQRGDRLILRQQPASSDNPEASEQLPESQ